MKVLVLSDTHRNMGRAVALLRDIQGSIDIIIHLGDNTEDAEFLRKHYSPHYTAIVTGTHIKLVCDELNTPMLDGYDEGEERDFPHNRADENGDGVKGGGLMKFFKRIFGDILLLEDVVIPAIIAGFISAVISLFTLVTVSRMSP